MTIIRRFEQHKPLSIKPGQIELFQFFENISRLPVGGVVTGYWFHRPTVEPYECLGLQYRFQFGNVTWDWVPLSELTSSSGLSFAIDLRKGHHYMFQLEFRSPELEIQEFKPVLYLVERFV